MEQEVEDGWEKEDKQALGFESAVCETLGFESAVCEKQKRPASNDTPEPDQAKSEESTDDGGSEGSYCITDTESGDSDEEEEMDRATVGTTEQASTSQRIGSVGGRLSN